MKHPYHVAVLSLTLTLIACGGSEPVGNYSVNTDADTTNLGVYELPIPDVSQNVEDSSNTIGVEQAACANRPATGDLLEGRRFSGRGHLLEIHNGAGGDAIVKIRDAGSRELVTSFFVAQGTTASVSGIPDGQYRIQYAFGPALAEDCRSFTSISSASEFPDVDSLVAERDAEGNPVNRFRLSYTLYSVPEGNTQPTQIDPTTFNQ